MTLSRCSYKPDGISRWSEIPSEEFILDIDDKVVIESVLRFLPGKRLVAKAVIAGKPVVVKLFLGSSHSRHYDREISGLKSVESAKIRTPALIKTRQHKQYSCVITEFLTNNVSLEELWNSDLNDEARINLLQRLMEIIGRLHRTDALHEDPHLGNFLIQNDEIYLIDGGGIVQQRNPISSKAALENLALFLSTLFPRFDHISLKCFPKYENSYRSIETDKEELLNSIRKKRKWRERYLEKVFRTCTDFVAESSFTHFQVIDRSENSPELLNFLESPDSYIHTGKILKRGKTNTVAIVTLNNGKEVFVKRYKSKKGFLHKYVRGFRKSRARNAWYIAHYLLRLLGVDTPKPIALLEKRFGAYVGCSYLITEYVEAENALDYFLNLKKVTKKAQSRADSIMQIMQTMKNSMVYHGDLKATNFILTNDREMIIDLDQSVILDSENRFDPYYKKDSLRFKKNWPLNSISEEIFSRYQT